MTNTPEEGPHPDLAAHEALARWAAECAERTLPIFEKCRPGDNRPRTAIESLRAWERDALPMTACRAAAFAAHAAARAAVSPASVAAARAAGQAAAVAHMLEHSPHAAMYAAKARGLEGSGEPCRRAERIWQWENLLPSLRPIGFPSGR